MRLGLKAPVGTQFMRQAHYSLKMFCKAVFLLKMNLNAKEKKKNKSLSPSVMGQNYWNKNITETILNIVLVNPTSQVLILKDITCLSSAQTFSSNVFV